MQHLTVRRMMLGGLTALALIAAVALTAPPGSVLAEDREIEVYPSGLFPDGDFYEPVDDAFLCLDYALFCPMEND
jgi:hypothetical protein